MDFNSMARHASLPSTYMSTYMSAYMPPYTPTYKDGSQKCVTHSWHPQIRACARTCVTSACRAYSLMSVCARVCARALARVCVMYVCARAPDLHSDPLKNEEEMLSKKIAEWL